jgi:protein-S-isoprenylcysteine O-methyltransferase Ste14
MKSLIVTSIQFICLGWILFTNPIYASHVFLLSLQLAGGVLGMWAILEMLKSKIHVAPNVRKGASLITSGPYKVLRHPMYTSLILFLGPLVGGYPNIENLAVFTVLLINLFVKLNYEESLLRQHFPDYEMKMKGRWRLLPGIY